MLCLICSVGCTTISLYNITDTVTNAVMLLRTFSLVFKQKKCSKDSNIKLRIICIEKKYNFKIHIFKISLELYRKDSSTENLLLK